MRPIRARLSRQELYEKVWRTPVYKVAQEFGVSPINLGKVLRTHKIPTPTLEYWNRINAGQQLQPTPLPTVAGPAQIELFGLTKERTRMRNKRPDTDVKIPAVVVDRTGPLRHPLARRTEWLLSKGKRDEAGIVVSEKGLVEHLRVSQKVLRRALRILDALFLAFSQHPFGLIWPEGSDKKLDIEVLG